MWNSLKRREIVIEGRREECLHVWEKVREGREGKQGDAGMYGGKHEMRAIMRGKGIRAVGSRGESCQVDLEKIWKRK